MRLNLDETLIIMQRKIEKLEDEVRLLKELLTPVEYDMTDDEISDMVEKDFQNG